MTNALTTIQPQPVDLSSDAGLIQVRGNREKFPLWRDYEKTVRVAFLIDKIIYCNLMKHRTNYDKQIIAIDAVELDNAIIKHSSLRNLTAPEIEEALKSGTRGEYGEVQLTPDFFRSYLIEFARRHAHIDRLDLPREKTPQEKLISDLGDFYAKRMLTNTKITKK